MLLYFLSLRRHKNVDIIIPSVKNKTEVQGINLPKTTEIAKETLRFKPRTL